MLEITKSLLIKYVLTEQSWFLKFVSGLQQVGGFTRGTLVSSTNKTDRHDMTEILLKVALKRRILRSDFKLFGLHKIHCMYYFC